MSKGEIAALVVASPFIIIGLIVALRIVVGLLTAILAAIFLP